MTPKSVSVNCYSRGHDDPLSSEYHSTSDKEPHWVWFKTRSRWGEVCGRRNTNLDSARLGPWTCSPICGFKSRRLPQVVYCEGPPKDRSRGRKLERERSANCALAKATSKFRSSIREPGSPLATAWLRSAETNGPVLTLQSWGAGRTMPNALAITNQQE